MHGINADHPVAPRRSDDGHLAAELIRLVRLALGNAFHFRRVHAVDLLRVLALLTEDALTPLQQESKRRSRVRALAPDVANYAPKVLAQSLGFAPGALHLPGVGVATLPRQSLFA